MHGPYAAAKTRDLWTHSREAVLNDGPLFHASTNCFAIYICPVAVGWVGGQRGLSWFNKYPARGSGKHRYHATLKPTRFLSLSAARANQMALYLHAPFTCDSHFSHAVRAMRVLDPPNDRTVGDKTNLNRRRSFVGRSLTDYFIGLRRSRLFNTPSDQSQFFESQMI